MKDSVDVLRSGTKAWASIVCISPSKSKTRAAVSICSGAGRTAMRPFAGQQSSTMRQLCVTSASPVCVSTCRRAAEMNAAISGSSSAVSRRRKAFASASDSGSAAGGVSRMDAIVMFRKLRARHSGGGLWPAPGTVEASRWTVVVYGSARMGGRGQPPAGSPPTSPRRTERSNS